MCSKSLQQLRDHNSMFTETTHLNDLNRMCINYEQTHVLHTDEMLNGSCHHIKHQVRIRQITVFDQTRHLPK